MKLLAIDTALNACSVAICDGADILSFHYEDRARGHAETLFPILQAKMKEAALEFSELDGIAVTIGPGTFTGLRIGLAAARGLAVSQDIPCIGITTLEALAASAPRDEKKSVIPIIDARRGEVFIQEFEHAEESGSIIAKSEPKALSLEVAANWLGDKQALVFGSGVSLLDKLDAFDTAIHTKLDLNPNPDARIIAKVALAKGLPAKGTPPPNPVYLRDPDAKLPSKKK